MKIKMLVLIIMAQLVLVSGNTFAISYTKEISQDEVQRILDHKFPISKKKYFSKFTFSDPIVSFIGKDNRVGVLSNVKVNLPGKLSGSGSVGLNGSLRYDNDSGSFFLDKIKVEKLTINGLSAKNTQKVEKLLEPIAKKVLHKVPVYKFKDNIKQELAKAILKSVTIKDHKALVELGVF